MRDHLENNERLDPKDPSRLANRAEVAGEMIIFFALTVAFACFLQITREVVQDGSLWTIVWYGALGTFAAFHGKVGMDLLDEVTHDRIARKVKRFW